MTTLKVQHAFEHGPNENIQVYSEDGSYRQRISTAQSTLDGRIHCFYDIHENDIVSIHSVTENGMPTHTVYTPVFYKSQRKIMCFTIARVDEAIIRKIHAGDSKNNSLHCRTKASLVQNVLLTKTTLGNLIAVIPTNTALETTPIAISAFPEITVIKSNKPIDRHGAVVTELELKDGKFGIVSQTKPQPRLIKPQGDTAIHMVEHVQKGTLKLTFHCLTEQIFNDINKALETELVNYEYTNIKPGLHQRIYRITAIRDTTPQSVSDKDSGGDKPESN